MDNSVLEPVPPKEQPGITSLKHSLAGQPLSTLLQKLMERFDVSANQLAVSAGIDESALHKILKGEHREFKAQHVDALLDDLQTLGKLTNETEREIWKKELRIAAYVHYDFYKTVEPRLSEIEDPEQRERILTEYERNLRSALSETYDKDAGQFPALLPLAYAFARYLSEKMRERTSKSESSALPEVPSAPKTRDTSGLVLVEMKEHYNLLPKLHTDKACIRRTDSGEVILLKGAKILSPIHYQPQESLSRAIEYIHVIKSLNGNLVDVPFFADAVLKDSRANQRNLQELKSIIETAERNAMYVSLTASSQTGRFLDIGFPSEHVIDTLSLLVAELRPYNNVLINLWDEVPEKNPAEQWWGVIDYAIRRIREINSDLIVGVPGAKGGRDFSIYMNHPLHYNNIMYRVKANPYVDSNATPDTKDSDVRRMWEVLYDGNHVVLFGEFQVPTPSKWNQTELEQDWMRKVLRDVNRYGFHYAAFHLHLGKLGLMNLVGAGSYVLSTRGEVIVEDLQQHPPEQYDQ